MGYDEKSHISDINTNACSNLEETDNELFV